MTASNQAALDHEVNQAAEAAPAINYQMIDEKGDTYPVDDDVAAIIHEAFWRITHDQELKDFISAANKEITKRHGSDIDIIGNLGNIYISKIKGAYINNVERLKVVLGKSFATLVKDEEIATQDLIAIACDADNPLSPEVRGCITIKDIVNISWHPHMGGNPNWRDI